MLYEQISKRKEEQQVFENYLIEALQKNNFLLSIDADFFFIIKKLRNISSHPSGHKPSAEEARFVFYEVINRFLSKPVLSTRHYADSLISKICSEYFFPVGYIDESAEIIAEELRCVHKDTYSYIISKLLSKYDSGDDALKNKIDDFIAAWCHAEDDENFIEIIKKEILIKKCTYDDYSKLLFSIISSSKKILTTLDNITIRRIGFLIRKHAIVSMDDLSHQYPIDHPITVMRNLIENDEAFFFENYKSEFSLLIEVNCVNQFLIQTIYDINNERLNKIYGNKLIAYAVDSIKSYRFEYAFKKMYEQIVKIAEILIPSDAYLVFTLMLTMRKSVGENENKIDFDCNRMNKIRSKARLYYADPSNKDLCVSLVNDSLGEGGRELYAYCISENVN